MIFTFIIRAREKRKEKAMAKIVDVVGNEFKVGCVFEMTCDKDKREVLKILDDGVVTMKLGDGSTGIVWESFLLVHNKARIVSYRSLAPDKNGKMLCEGDTVLNRWNEKRIVRGLCLDTLLTSDKDGLALGWTISKDFTFFSRPTDQQKSAEAIALEQLIKDGEEAKRKLDEALKKAKE
ncbi:hypothetical protein M0R72_13340 [Candidatus Pacearchaeota archaeon]|jgi:hypothetical protein|nr:hypothetical protein [Candidatus Pacearchaeota archaeon]